MMDTRWLEAIGRTTCVVARKALPSLCALAMLAGVATSATNAYAEEASGTNTTQTTTDTTGGTSTDTTDTTGTTTDSTDTSGSSEDTSGSSDSTGATGDSSDTDGASGDAAGSTGLTTDSTDMSDTADASDEPAVVTDDSSGDDTGVSADEGVSVASDDGTDAQADSTTWDPKNAKAYTEYEVTNLKPYVYGVRMTMNGQSTTATRRGTVPSGYTLRFNTIDITSETERNAIVQTTYNCKDQHMTLARDADELLKVVNSSMGQTFTTADQAFGYLAENCFPNNIQKANGDDATYNDGNVARTYTLSKIGLPNNEGYTYDGVWLQYNGQLRMRLAWMGSVQPEGTSAAKDAKRYVLAYDESKDYTEQCKPWIDGSKDDANKDANKCMLTEVPAGASIVVSFVNTGSIRVGYRGLTFENTGTGLNASKMSTTVSGDASTHASGSIDFEVTKQYAGSTLKLYVQKGYTSDSSKTCDKMDTTNTVLVYDSSSGGGVQNDWVSVTAGGALDRNTNRESFTLNAASDKTLGGVFSDGQTASTRGFLLCAEESITKSGSGMGEVANTKHSVTVLSRADGLSGPQVGNTNMRGTGQQSIGMLSATYYSGGATGNTTVSAQDIVAYAGRQLGNTSRSYDDSTLRNQIAGIGNWNNPNGLGNRSAGTWNTSIQSGNANYQGENVNLSTAGGLQVHNGGTVLMVAHNSVRYEPTSSTSSTANAWSQLLSSVLVCASVDGVSSPSCDYADTMQRVNVPAYKSDTGNFSISGKSCARTDLTSGALKGISVTVCEAPMYSEGVTTGGSLMHMHPYYIVLEGVTTDVSVKLVWSAANLRVINMGQSTGVTSIEARIATYVGNGGVEWNRDSATWESIHKWKDNQLRFKWDSWPNEIAASKPGGERQEIDGQYAAGRGALFRLKLALGYTNYEITVSNTTGEVIKLQLKGSNSAAAPGSEGHSDFWDFGHGANECYFDSEDSSSDRFLYCYVYTENPKSSTNPYRLNVSATPVTYQAVFDAGENVTEGKGDGEVDADSMPVDVSYDLAGTDPSAASIEVQNVTPTRKDSVNTKYYFAGWDVYWCNAVADGKCTKVGGKITELDSLVSKVAEHLQPGMTVPLGLVSIPTDAVGVMLRAVWDTDNTVRTVTSTFGKAYYYLSLNTGSGIVSSWIPITNWSGTAPSFTTEKVSFIMPVPDDYENSKLATTYKYSTTDPYKPPATATADVLTDGVSSAKLTVSLVSDKSCENLLGGTEVSQRQKNLYCTTDRVTVDGRTLTGLGNDIAKANTKFAPNPTSTSGNKSGTLMVAVYRVAQKAVYADNISMLNDNSFKPSLCWYVEGLGCYPMGDGSSAVKPSIASRLANSPAYTGRYLYDNYYLPQVAASDDPAELAGMEPVRWKIENNNSRTVTFNGWSNRLTSGGAIADSTKAQKVSYKTDPNKVDWYGQWTASLPPVSQLPLTGTKPWWMQVVVPAVLVALLGLAAWLKWRSGSKLWRHHA
ncbi:cell surface protein [Bifidobacterium lemurum]|uniref:Cell surface protein n=1 Tax=Bifidobacterium lemurum TaxID=1603886 RepID=A0A261FRP4_9BIFI|nr:hypothetical protein [Bifidobacterium lemurum]OZG61476.1 cell surface protein [Bifidobacterium lemurum]QOL35101.1 hypothetical protein BL8807_04345 [Bifidobacterium lemurum]